MDTDIDNRDIEIDTNITSNIIYLGNLFFNQEEICFGWGLNRGKAKHRLNTKNSTRGDSTFQTESDSSRTCFHKCDALNIRNQLFVSC